MLASPSHTRGSLLFLLAALSLFGLSLYASDTGPHTTSEPGLSEDEFYGRTIMNFVLSAAQEAPDDIFILCIDNVEYNLQLDPHDSAKLITKSDMQQFTSQIKLLKDFFLKGKCLFESSYFSNPRVKLYRRALACSRCCLKTSDITKDLRRFFYAECAKRFGLR